MEELRKFCVVGSDSDLSEDSDSESETFSESSGSGTRLSQEDLSSNEEDSDTPEAEHPTKDFPPSEMKKAQPAGELPQQSVASLQDLSNKMFQVRIKLMRVCRKYTIYLKTNSIVSK